MVRVGNLGRAGASHMASDHELNATMRSGFGEVVDINSFQLAGFYWLHLTFKLGDQRSPIRHREPEDYQ